MNNKEKQLAATFLEMASDEFGNHGCNDVDEEVDFAIMSFLAAKMVEEK